MWEDPKFLVPGSDGELHPDTNLWRKGLVYTGAAWPLVQVPVGHNAEILVGFKKGVRAANSLTGFQSLYERVTAIASRRISEWTCTETGAMPTSKILCHGWRCLGADLVTAFIHLGLWCQDQIGDSVQRQPKPSEEDLRSPGGVSLEELARLNLTGADEIYNEFDFTNSSTPGPDFVTLSYGERLVSYDEKLGFGPIVERAERLARWYHDLLRSFDELSSLEFRIARRDWFLASQTFATIHICFDR